MEKKIPKIIHYVWFGNQPLSDLATKCIKSWEKFAPDFQLMRWDESSFDISSNRYVMEAYQSKKWAFVSDYVRLYALYHHGGIYMDTDVELIKPIDHFLIHNAFSGFEQTDTIPTAIMGSIVEHPWIKYLLSYYDQRSFIQTDGSFDMTTNVVTITQMTKDKYEVELTNQYQELDDGLVFYPNDYFCPKSYETGKVNLTDNTHCIHHFSGSWIDEGTLKSKNRLQKLQRFAGKKVGYTLYKTEETLSKQGFLGVVSKLITVPIKKLFDHNEYRILKLIRIVSQTKQNVIFFESEGDYCDNARALFNYMVNHGLNENFELIWKVKDLKKYSFLTRIKNVRVVSNQTRVYKIRLHYYLGRSNVFFFTHPYWMKEWKKNQRVINLWHGTPIKNSGSDLSAVFDYVIVSSDTTSRWMSKFLGSKSSQNVVLGAPRNDYLVSKRDIKTQLNISPTTKLVMCLPTFKQSSTWVDSEIHLPYVMQGLHTEEDVQLLNQTLENLDMQLIIKIHHLQKTDKILNIDMSRIRFLQDDDLERMDVQLYECLSVTDLLLTDYSSVYFDYLLLNRPIGFLHEDIDSYAKGRGFLFDNFQDYMPGKKLYSLKDCVDFLIEFSFGIDDFKDQRAEVNRVVNDYDFNNCQSILDYFKLM